MKAFAIRFYRRVYVKAAAPAKQPQRGWRPWVWTRSAMDAEKFGSREAAELFCRGLKGEGFEVYEMNGLGPSRMEPA